MWNDVYMLIASFDSMRERDAKKYAGLGERGITEATETESNRDRSWSHSRPMRYIRGALVASVVALTILLASQAHAAPAHTGFGFNGDLSGAAGAASLSGGGSFNLDREFIKAGGGFRCTEAITQGLLAGCEAGEGVRWDAEELLPSSGFKCIGDESLKTATTGATVVVMQADFYRAGDGNNGSFSAKMFVSEDDLDPEVDGVQNLWIQGLGCGPAVVNFSSR